MGLEGNWSWSFGRGIVRPMDGLSEEYMYNTYKDGKTHAGCNESGV
jgi:hypothetical protein